MKSSSRTLQEEEESRRAAGGVASEATVNVCDAVEHIMRAQRAGSGKGYHEW